MESLYPAPSVSSRSLPPSPRGAGAGISALYLLLVLQLVAQPLAAQVELGTPVDEAVPTTEDLNGIAAAAGGEVVVVGDGATVLRRTVDRGGNPVWASEGAWAAGFFSAEIFDVAHSPVPYPGGEGWVVAGRDAVVETDFTTTVQVDVRPGSGSIFTPVLPTADEIWYGVPDLGAFPSFLHRYDRTTQTAPGIAFPVGAVLAMCQVPGGSLRYVTTDGDIEEVDDNLQVTTLYDQDDGNSLELNAASFSEDCEVIAAGDAGSESRIYAGFIESTRGPSPNPWRFVSRNGEPVVTASCFLTSQEQGNIVGFFAIVLRCDDQAVETGDDATMSAFADFLESRINGVDTFNSERKCQRDGAVMPVPPAPFQAFGGPPASGFQLLTVGTEGKVQRIVGMGPLFGDGFETGDLSQWAVSVP